MTNLIACFTHTAALAAEGAAHSARFIEERSSQSYSAEIWARETRLKIESIREQMNQAEAELNRLTETEAH